MDKPGLVVGCGGGGRAVHKGRTDEGEDGSGHKLEQGEELTSRVVRALRKFLTFKIQHRSDRANQCGPIGYFFFIFFAFMTCRSIEQRDTGDDDDE